MQTAPLLAGCTRSCRRLTQGPRNHADMSGSGGGPTQELLRSARTLAVCALPIHASLVPHHCDEPMQALDFKPLKKIVHTPPGTLPPRSCHNSVKGVEDKTRIQPDKIDQEVVRRLREKSTRKTFILEILEIESNNHVRPPDEGRCDNVTIICVTHSRDKLQSALPPSYPRVRKCLVHLTSEPGDITAQLLLIATTLVTQTEDRPLHLLLNHLAPQRPESLCGTDLEQYITQGTGYQHAGVKHYREHCRQPSERTAASTSRSRAGSSSYPPIACVSATMSPSASSAARRWRR